MKQREFIDAEVVILSSDEGGRSTPLLPVAYQGRYRPHIVLQPRETRKATIEVREGLRHIVDLYLAVALWSGPDPIPISQPMTACLLLTYAPDQVYDAVVPGAEFTLREGPKIIGHGRVLRRWTEPKTEPGGPPNSGPAKPLGAWDTGGGLPSAS